LNLNRVGFEFWLASKSVHATILAGWPSGHTVPGLASCGRCHAVLCYWPLARACCTAATEPVVRWPPLLPPRVAMFGCCCAALSYVLAPHLYSSCRAVCTLPPSRCPPPRFSYCIVPRVCPTARRDVGDHPGSHSIGRSSALLVPLADASVLAQPCRPCHAIRAKRPSARSTGSTCLCCHERSGPPCL
jgi:hypothetical protein